MMRQVFIGGKHQWQDCGPGAAKAHHGNGPVRSMITATRLGHTAPVSGPVSTRKASKGQRR